MAASSEGVLSKIASIFKRKRTPKQAITDLEAQCRDLEHDLSGLDFDMKDLSQELARYVKQGVNATEAGNISEAKKAASNVRLARTKLALKQRQWNLGMKSKMFCEMSKIHLEATMPDGFLARMTELGHLAEDSEIVRLIVNADVSLKDFERTLARTFSQIEAGTQAFAERSDNEDDEILVSFRQISESERKGDAKAASEARSRLLGLPEPPDQA
jgi:hypothetical protein